MNNKTNFFTRLVQNSIILSMLDRFTTFIRNLIKNGFFGFIFTGYTDDQKSLLFKERKSKSKIILFFSDLRHVICELIEHSFIINSVKKFFRSLLECRLKVIGIFLLSFGIYSSVIMIIKNIVNNRPLENILKLDFIILIILIIASLPIAFSKKTLHEALTSSYVGIKLLSFFEYEEDVFYGYKINGGHTLIAMITGFVLSVLTFWVSPIYIIGGLVVIVSLYMILIKPEIGAVLLFVLMPWLPTMVLTALVIYSVLCFALKIFRRKRIFKFDIIDVSVIGFMILTLFGGLISLSSESLKPALLMTCLMMSYFLVAHLPNNRKWLIKCSVGAVLSATVNSIYGIAAYYLGIGYSSKAWIDSEMFDNIAGRAVSTLENPNMLGEYLIIILPIAIAMIFGKGEGLRRLYALICSAIIGVCLILTWSRGAWLALVVALIILILIWHRRSIWLLFAGIISLPVAVTFLPQSILSRITSIGNMADSSTSYRVYTWQAAVNMIKNNLFTGIGIGENAWRRVYPLYSYMGVEAAPHSHNLFFQITLELGLFGLIVFLIFLFLVMKSAFSELRLLSDENVLLKGDLGIESNSDHGYSSNRITKLTKLQLKMSTAGPLCGLFAVLIQGLTDYSWYNYRLFLMFWLICGLVVAYSKSGRMYIVNEKNEVRYDADTSYDSDIIIEKKKKSDIDKEKLTVVQ